MSNKQQRVAANHYNHEKEQCTVAPVQFTQERGNSAAISEMDRKAYECMQGGDEFIPATGACVPKNEVSPQMRDPKSVAALEETRKMGGIPDYDRGQAVAPSLVHPVAGVDPRACSIRGGFSKTRPGGSYDMTGGGTCYMPGGQLGPRWPKPQQRKGLSIGVNRTPRGQDKIYDYCAPHNVQSRTIAENPMLFRKAQGPGRGAGVAREQLMLKIAWANDHCK